jgi:hypothetical protein
MIHAPAYATGSIVAHRRILFPRPSRVLPLRPGLLWRRCGDRKRDLAAGADRFARPPLESCVRNRLPVMAVKRQPVMAITAGKTAGR